MTVLEPECSKRKCKHFIDTLVPNNPIFNCAAFPNGIPDDIAYGDNKHLKPVAGDHGIQFEKEPE